MPKRIGSIFVTVGAVLMMSALLLSFYNKNEEYRAGQQAEMLMNDIQAVIPVQEESAVSISEIETDASESTKLSETLSAELPKVMIDGYDYIGYLSVPALSLELPVMADWDYARLKIAPCRHFGSSRSDDLVIAAHNYKSHFGSLSGLAIGDEICFTDMDGMVNRYTLSKLETLAPEEVDAVQNSGYDLVLYTCSSGGMLRVAAFCDRITNENIVKMGS